MDLKKLLKVLDNNITITIVELYTSSNCIFEGVTSNFHCKEFEYDVIKLGKNHFDGSYSIIVIKNNSSFDYK